MFKRALYWAYGMALVVAAGFVGLYYLQLPLLEGVEARTWDSRLRLARSPLHPAAAFAIIAIDEKSIGEIGRFPWSRSTYARFIDSLRTSGSQTVLMDILFPDPESAAADDLLARALRQHGKVILAEFFEFDASGRAVRHRQSMPELRTAASGTGHINLFPDEDGVIRWSALTLPFQGGQHFSLAFQGAAASLGSPPAAVAPFSLRLGGRSIPTDDQHRMLINYAASSGTFETFSFTDVLHGRVAPERLRNRVIFVGATAVGIYDMRVTPLSGNTPGVVLNALVADSIARGSFVQRGGLQALIDLLAILLLSVVTTAILLHTRHLVALPLLLAIALGYLAGCHAALKAGSWISMIYPLGAMLFSFVCAAFVRFLLLDRRAREVRAMFSRFVSAKVVDRLVKHPELACVSGDSRIVTILFADLQNYTSFSERHSPAETVAVLNLYLSEMSSVIMEFDGTLDKFLGDGILAYWNAPLEQPNHAEAAVRCALEMIRRGEMVRQRIARQCGEPLSWGIGINTGEVVAGIIGAAEKKMEYTVIGDNVNLTYRIQNVSRDVGLPIITRSLYELVADMVEVEPMPPVQVKGREQAVEVFMLKGLKDG